MFSGDFSIQPIVFTPSKTAIAGVRTEYYLIDKGVKLHLWPDPEFPKDFGASILRAWRGFPKESIIVEYVPEVDSWYAEAKNVGLGLTANLVERLIEKIAVAVRENGHPEEKK